MRCHQRLVGRAGGRAACARGDGRRAACGGGRHDSENASLPNTRQVVLAGHAVDVGQRDEGAVEVLVLGEAVAHALLALELELDGGGGRRGRGQQRRQQRQEAQPRGRAARARHRGRPRVRRTRRDRGDRGGARPLLRGDGRELCFLFLLGPLWPLSLSVPADLRRPRHRAVEARPPLSRVVWRGPRRIRRGEQGGEGSADPSSAFSSRAQARRRRRRATHTVCRPCRRSLCLSAAPRRVTRSNREQVPTLLPLPLACRSLLAPPPGVLNAVVRADRRHGQGRGARARERRAATAPPQRRRRRSAPPPLSSLSLPPVRPPLAPPLPASLSHPRLVAAPRAPRRNARKRKRTNRAPTARRWSATSGRRASRRFGCPRRT